MEVLYPWEPETGLKTLSLFIKFKGMINLQNLHIFFLQLIFEPFRSKRNAKSIRFSLIKMGICISRPPALALAPNLYLPALVLNLYLPAVAPNVC